MSYNSKRINSVYKCQDRVTINGTNGEITERRHGPGAGLSSDAAVIFVVGNIPDVMRHIFNAQCLFPMDGNTPKIFNQTSFAVNVDAFVKSQNLPYFVLPAKRACPGMIEAGGIQSFQ